MKSFHEKALYTMVILFTAILAYWSVTRYEFGTFFPFYDFTIFEQSIWSTLHGINPPVFLYNSVEGMSHFGVHVSPILYLLCAPYAFLPFPETLLVVQAILLTTAAIPLFYLAHEILHDKRYALIIAIAYLMYAPLTGAALFDFHEVAFVPILAFATLYAMFRCNTPAVIMGTLLLLSVKEDMVLVVVPMLAYYLYMQGKNPDTSRRDRYITVALIGIACLWFLISVFVIIPSLNPSGIAMHTARYNLTDIPTMVTQYPMEKFSYLSSLITPLGVIPLASPVTLALSAPMLLEILLQDGVFRFTSYTQYVLQVIPFLFLSFIFGIKFIRDYHVFRDIELIPLITVIVVAVFLITSQVSPTSPDFYIFENTNHTDAVLAGMSKIPDGASLYMGSYFVPGSGQREELYSTYHHGVEYLFVDENSTFFNKTDFGRYDLSNYENIYDNEGVMVYRYSTYPTTLLH
jgi:uncharacterized membrane protein